MLLWNVQYDYLKNFCLTDFLSENWEILEISEDMEISDILFEPRNIYTLAIVVMPLFFTC